MHKETFETVKFFLTRPNIFDQTGILNRKGKTEEAVRNDHKNYLEEQEFNEAKEIINSPIKLELYKILTRHTEASFKQFTVVASKQLALAAASYLGGLALSYLLSLGMQKVGELTSSGQTPEESEYDKLLHAIKKEFKELEEDIKAFIIKSNFVVVIKEINDTRTELSKYFLEANLSDGEIKGFINGFATQLNDFLTQYIYKYINMQVTQISVQNLDENYKDKINKLKDNLILELEKALKNPNITSHGGKVDLNKCAEVLNSAFIKFEIEEHGFFIRPEKIDAFFKEFDISQLYNKMSLFKATAEAMQKSETEVRQKVANYIRDNFKKCLTYYKKGDADLQNFIEDIRSGKVPGDILEIDLFSEIFQRCIVSFDSYNKPIIYGENKNYDLSKTLFIYKEGDSYYGILKIKSPGHDNTKAVYEKLKMFQEDAIILTYPPAHHQHTDTLLVFLFKCYMSQIQDNEIKYRFTIEIKKLEERIGNFLTCIFSSDFTGVVKEGSLVRGTKRIPENCKDKDSAIKALFNTLKENIAKQYEANSFTDIDTFKEILFRSINHEVLFNYYEFMHFLILVSEAIGNSDEASMYQSSLKDAGQNMLSYLSSIDPVLKAILELSSLKPGDGGKEFFMRSALYPDSNLYTGYRNEDDKYPDRLTVDRNHKSETTNEKWRFFRSYEDRKSLNILNNLNIEEKNNSPKYYGFSIQNTENSQLLASDTHFKQPIREKWSLEARLDNFLHLNYEHKKYSKTKYCWMAGQADCTYENGWGLWLMLINKNFTGFYLLALGAAFAELDGFYSKFDECTGSELEHPIYKTYHRMINSSISNLEQAKMELPLLCIETEQKSKNYRKYGYVTFLKPDSIQKLEKSENDSYTFTLKRC